MPRRHTVRVTTWSPYEAPFVEYERFAFKWMAQCYAFWMSFVGAAHPNTPIQAEVIDES